MAMEKALHTRSNGVAVAKGCGLASIAHQVSLVAVNL
jgi:hypothetical protein